jgi:hypothetical protein
MGSLMNSGNVTASILNNAATQHNITFSSAFQNNGTVTLTVPAGKRWTIISAALSVYSTNNSGDDSVITANGVNIIAVTAKALTTYQSGEANQSQRWDYTAAPQLSTGQTITIVTGANTHSGYVVGYLEESV